MADDYTPLFNRTYLKILVWACAITILLLATLGEDEVDFPAFGQQPERGLYWLEHDSRQHQLAILLPTRSALHPADALLQQLQADILEARLKAADLPPRLRYSIRRHLDRMELELHWPQDSPAPQPAALLQALSQPVNGADWQTRLGQLQARQYLQDRTLESRLLATFFRLLAGEAQFDLLQMLETRYSAMFHQPRFVVSGADAAALAARFAAELPRLQPDSPHQQSLNTLPQHLALASEDRRHHLLLGRSGPRREEPQFVPHRLAAQVLQDLLSRHAPALGLEYRLRWGALADSGYQAVLLHSDTPPLPKLTQLQAKLNDRLVDDSRRTLLEQWQASIQTPEDQARALRSLAFYNLPADSLATYAAQLQQADSATVLNIVHQGLQADSQISILVPAS